MKSLLKRKLVSIPVLLFLFCGMITGCSEDDSKIKEESLDETNLSKNLEAIPTEEEYQIMMSDLRSDIDSILLTYKPESIDLVDYKIGLINGEYEVDVNMEQAIETAYSDLYNYGLMLASTHEVEIDIQNSSEALALAGLYMPNSDFTEIWEGDNYLNIYTNPEYEANNIDWGDIGRCALVAIGADIVYSLSQETGEQAAKWAVKKIVKAFARVAARFVGPIGAAIAAVSFGVCLGEAAL